MRRLFFWGAARPRGHLITHSLVPSEMVGSGGRQGDSPLPATRPILWTKRRVLKFTIDSPRRLPQDRGHVAKKCIDVAIIGAGIAGMSAAAHLHQAGFKVEVFDKARGPGGRTASRRQDELRFDHGAPCFEVQDPSFLALLSEWQRQGLVMPWSTQVATLKAPNEPLLRPSQSYVGLPKMSALARAIGQGVTCNYSTRIASLKKLASTWQLVDTESHTYFAKRILSTAPPPQTLELLANHAPAISQALRQVEPCPDWTLMLQGHADLLAPEIGRLHFEGHPCLSQLIAEHRKPQRPAQAAWTLHASSSWSKSHEEAEPEWVIEQLCAALSQSLGQSLSFETIKAHRWRYARVRNNLSASYLNEPQGRLYYAGDACLRGDLESAYLSGVRAAQAIAGQEDPSLAPPQGDEHEGA